MKNRIESIDYLRCVCIILMVIFHLAYIGDKYPYLKQIVYTFHMPVFLLISGYLANTNKPPKQFARSVLCILLPYAIMETGYVILSDFLPVREKPESLSVPFLLEKIFFSPMGPYWYLHSLIIFYTTYYLTDKACSERIDKVSYFMLLGICCWMLAEARLVALSNAIYFIGGVIISKTKGGFFSVFHPSGWAILPLVILCCYPENLDRHRLSGILITYLVISLLLEFYRHKSPRRIALALQAIGRNTLPILLFSPIFTMTAKLLLPLFAFDNTGIGFTLVSVPLAVGGSLLIAWGLDKTNLSRFFCGKKKILV